MLGFFRNLTKSKWGLAILFGFLALIAFAFAAGDVTGLRQGGPALTSKTLATVGDRAITEAELRAQIDDRLTMIRRQGQPVTMEEFLARGGFEAVLDDVINVAALEEFGKATGMTVSRELIDGEIASAPGFQGPDGKFSQKRFDQAMIDQRMSPAKLRSDLTTDRYRRWLIARVQRGAQLPNGVVNVYASLMLERRLGTVAVIPAESMQAGPDPDDAALTAFYNANRARYSVPARRTLRYATLGPDQFRAQAAATDAEIAAAYRAAGARYAASEKRTVELVTALDQAAATAVANRAKGGATLTAAATASGLSARTLTGVEKAELGRQVSEAFANAAFTAAADQLTGPVRVGPSWFVYKVSNVEKIAARPLESVRAELATEVTARKVADAMAAMRLKLEDEIGEGAEFDELMSENKLQGATTPSLTAAATDPDNPDYKADPAVVQIVRGGFGIDPEHPEPGLVPLGEDGSFAVVAIGKVTPAAPRPLAQIRDRVKADFHADKQFQAARTAAQAIVRKVDAGTPLAQALAEAGVRGPAPRNFDLKGSDVHGRQVPPEVAMAFAMAPKKAKLVPAPNRAGFFVVYLDRTEQKDASGDAALIGRVRAELAEPVAIERAMQFVESVKKHLKVARNEAAIAAAKRNLASGGPAAQ